MNWDKLSNQFANFLKLERSLSENTIDAYERDVAKLKQFVGDLQSGSKPSKYHYSAASRFPKVS
jgi:integrase/recombinase XerD